MTAVEFLHSKYIKIFGELNPSTGKLLEIAYAIEQAKEIEKKQIVNAHNCGYSQGIYQNYESGEQYYNETFKSE